MNAHNFLLHVFYPNKTIMSNTPLPSVEVVYKWSPKDVIIFLESKKDELFLRDQDIKIIRKNKVAGRAFLEEMLVCKPGLFELPYGPARAITKSIRDIKGEEQGKYHNCI